MIESIDFERLVWLNQFHWFHAKKGQRNRRLSQKSSTKSKVSKKGQQYVDWLIWLNHLSYSCELIESVHTYLVTWLIYSSKPIHGDWINTFSHSATIELINLAWVVYKSAQKWPEMAIESIRESQNFAFVGAAVFKISLTIYDQILDDTVLHGKHDWRTVSSQWSALVKVSLAIRPRTHPKRSDLHTSPCRAVFQWLVFLGAWAIHSVWESSW